MKVFICSDSFKGTLSSRQVNDILYQELVRNPYFSCQSELLADGGEGALEAIGNLPNTEKHQLEAHDPYGRRITTTYLSCNNDAYIELAAISGIALLGGDELHPLMATTYGTGELIKNALVQGYKSIHLFLGGSATVDGGTGLANALLAGTKKQGNQLFNSASIDLQRLKTVIQDVDITLITDVNNSILGKEGAVQVFGPQKGVLSSQLPLFENEMKKWTELLSFHSGKDLKTISGLGAAGGAGLPLYSFANTKIVKGFDYFNQVLSYTDKIQWADVVITGEGCIDDQTEMGKGPGEIARVAKSYGKHVIGIGGQVKTKSKLFDKLFACTAPDNSGNISQSDAIKNLQLTAQQVNHYLQKMLSL